MRIETVSIIHQSPRILLGMKKSKFGKGKYNGFGGGLEENETLEECAIRETFEETGRGIEIINPERIGRILFKFQTAEQDHLVHFFKVKEFRGVPKESREMKPVWFYEKDIPYEQMWDDDRYWLPLLLKNKKFQGEMYFDAKHKIMVPVAIEEVSELEVEVIER